MKSFMMLFNYTVEHLDEILTSVVIMVSAIIVLIDALKPLVFNKIKSKDLRSVALSVTSIAACFAASAVDFWVEGYNFYNYPTAAIALSICCVFTYWGYSKFKIRKGILFLGKSVLSKVFSALVMACATQDADAVKADLKKTKAELKKTASLIKEDDLSEI